MYDVEKFMGELKYLQFPITWLECNLNDHRILINYDHQKIHELTPEIITNHQLLNTNIRSSLPR